MSWPRRLPARTCADCDGLLVDDQAAKDPIYTWAVPLTHAPRFWNHHRRQPGGFDLGTSERLECSRCGRIAMLAARPVAGLPRSPARARRLPTKKPFASRNA